MNVPIITLTDFALHVVQNNNVICDIVGNGIDGSALYVIVLLTPLYVISVLCYMPYCHLCENDCLESDLKRWVYEHSECSEEGKRRVNNMSCIKYDQNSVLEYSIFCGSCNTDSDFKNYPGGSA